MNTVGYARLSRDEDKENYSSIESQMEIIQEYAAKRGWKVSKFYIDDNYSGYTFNRPGFKEMKNDLENGHIDIIIAKDLSRIGRHNARTQLFIEEIQEMGKQIVLPEEGRGYDSSADDDDILGIKTWYNERYVKDISRKVRANMHMRQKKGELIMGNMYGYVKDPQNKSQLLVDEKVRPVIELIFRLYLEGNGYKKISSILNKKGCPTPSMHIKEKHAEKGRVFKNAVSDKWQTHNIARIIQNDLYIGTLRTHKKQNKRVKGKQEKVSEEEQYVFENHHEPIIKREDFELVRRVHAKRREHMQKGNAKYPYVFSSFVYCGDCGFAATGRNLGRLPSLVRGYECTQYTKYGRERCVSHRVKEDKLVFFFKEFLRDVKEQYMEYLHGIHFAQKRKNAAESISRLQKELANLREELKLLLHQKIKDLMKETDEEYKTMIENSYIALENEKKLRIKELSNRVEELKKMDGKKIENNLKTAIDLFNAVIEADRPERKDLEMILDKIFIYGNRNIEFKLQVDIEKLTCSL